MEFIEDRRGKKSTIITSRVSDSNWHDLIGEDTVANAALERLSHQAQRLELKGESLRKKAKTEDKPT